MGMKMMVAKMKGDGERPYRAMEYRMNDDGEMVKRDDSDDNDGDEQLIVRN